MGKRRSQGRWIKFTNQVGCGEQVGMLYRNQLRFNPCGSRGGLSPQILLCDKCLKH